MQLVWLLTLKNNHQLLFLITAALLFQSCERKPVPAKSANSVNQQDKKADISRQNLGGETTVYDSSRKAYTLSARNLTSENKTQFFVGNSFFNKNWVQAPASASARDGIGPLFITRSCSSCHNLDGRGSPPSLGEDFTSLLFRISKKENGVFMPHPVFGDQIQTRSLSDKVSEPSISVEYEKLAGSYPDGTPYVLEKPIYTIDGTADLAVSPRVAQAVIGLGLLESIPEAYLEKKADPDDLDNDGISGKLNFVNNVVTGDLQIGRFGWKANQPSVLQQVAGAFNGDLGLTTSLFQKENHTKAQGKHLASLPSGGDPEVTDEILDAVTLYCQTIAVPARRDFTAKNNLVGEEHFNEIGCADCHASGMKTVNSQIPSLDKQSIFPYTDLLLHDMGDGLADGRPDGLANGKEWRTAPLWGIGLVETVNKHTRFLHDGRARNIEEAILWHGGEAERSKQNFKKLEKIEREAVISFLNSL